MRRRITLMICICMLSIPYSAYSGISGMSSPEDEVLWNEALDLIEQARSAHPVKALPLFEEAIEILDTIVKHYPASDAAIDLIMGDQLDVDELEMEIADIRTAIKAYEASDIGLCDRLAGHPDDTEAVSEGMEWDKLDVEQALPACQNAIERHPDMARLQFQLGRVYHKAEDLDKALEWYLRAAEQGYIAAYINLGSLYSDEDVEFQDYEKALKWYHRAAEQGSAIACGRIGRIYEHGGEKLQNYEKALEWYRKGAEMGDADAQADLGDMYEEGKEVTQDDKKALHWYLLAAEQGHARAQYNVGIMYNEGRGVSQNDEEAVLWFRKAADQGYARAQNSLGVMYKQGQGVPQDDAEAVLWYRKAAEQGNIYAQSNLWRKYKDKKELFQGQPAPQEAAIFTLQAECPNGDERIRKIFDVLIQETPQGTHPLAHEEHRLKEDYGCTFPQDTKDQFAHLADKARQTGESFVQLCQREVTQAERATKHDTGEAMNYFAVDREMLRILQPHNAERELSESE